METGNGITVFRGNSELSLTIDNLRAEINKDLQVDNLCFFLGAGCSSYKKEGSEIPTGTDKEPIEVGIPTMYDLFSEFSKCNEGFKICNEPIEGNFDHNLESVVEALEALKVLNGFRNSDNSSVLQRIKLISDFIKNKIIHGIDSGEIVKDLYKEFYKRISQKKRKVPISIFTTNYDMFNEIALDELGFPYNNGFIGTYKRKFNPASYNYMYVDNMDLSKDVWEGTSSFYNLIKLHGSISWVKDNGCVWEKDFNSLKDSDTLMIYPTPLKDRSTLMVPYSSLFRVMESKLNQKNCILFVLGYSFGDDHINQIILNALAVPSFRLVVFGDSENIRNLKKLNDKRILIVSSEDKIHYFSNFIYKVLPDVSVDILEKAENSLIDLKTHNVFGAGYEF